MTYRMTTALAYPGAATERKRPENDPAGRVGGILYAQYQLYVNPDAVSGIAISLQMVFGVIAGGMFVMLGPTVGAAFTLLLAEGLRLAFGNKYPALDTTIYGVMLVLFIIYMPKGILGAALELFKTRKSVPRRPTTEAL